MTRTPRYSLAERDAVEWLRTLPDASVDLLITDPAYESLEKHRALGTTTRLKKSKGSSNAWFHAIFHNVRFPELLQEVFRVLKADAHFYLFCDPETAFVVHRVNQELGQAIGRDGLFKFWKPLVFDKVRIGMGYHYRARYEFILFFEKGKRKLNDLGVADVITHPRVIGGYPTEKPVAVSEVLIRQSSTPGDLVVDPFMGSGSVGVAAVNLGRDFCGCDISPEAQAMADERLRAAGAEVMPLVLDELHSPKQLGLGIR